MKKYVLAATLVIAAIVGIPTAAHGVAWYSSTSPLNAKYDTAIRAQAYGNFTNYASSYARQSTTLRSRTDNPAYAQTAFRFYIADSAGVGPVSVGFTGWWTQASGSVTRSATTWGAYGLQTPLNTESSSARAQTSVCEQTPWYNPDVCSTNVVVGFTY